MAWIKSLRVIRSFLSMRHSRKTKKLTPNVSLGKSQIRSMLTALIFQGMPDGFSTVPTLRRLLRVQWAGPSPALDELISGKLAQAVDYVKRAIRQDHILCST